MDLKETIEQIKAKNFYLEYTNNKDKKELILMFNNVRLLTLNELLSAIQYKKWDVFAYKKAIKETMTSVFKELKKKYKDEYLFEEDEVVDLFIYRRGKKLIDNDSLPACFKYFIDSFSNNKIIKDDNPHFIDSVKCYQETNKESGKEGLCFILKIKAKKLSKKTKKTKIKEELNFIREL